MKIILLICLVVSLNCDILSTAICIIRNEKVISVASKLISSITEKKWSEIPEIFFSNFSEIKEIAQNCLKEKKEKEEDEDDVKLGRDYYFLRKCLHFCERKRECIDCCIREYGPLKKWSEIKKCNDKY